MSKKTEAAYRTIVSAALDGFWILDIQGRFLDVNDYYCRLMGYSREELMRMSLTDVEAIEEPEETAARIERIVERGWDRFETQHRRKDGRVVDIEVSAGYLPVEGGRMFVFLRDVTELKRAEERRERRAEKAPLDSEEMYRSIVDASPDAIIVSGTDDTITKVSSKAVEMLGYESEDEITGRNVFGLFAPEEREKAAENRRRRFEGVPTGFIEYTMLKKDGTRLDVELSATAFYDSTGNPKGVIGIARDITERKLAEEAVRHSEERSRSLFESSIDGIVVMGPEGKIIEANQAYQDMLGYTLDEIKELTYAQLTPEKWHQLEMGILRDQILERGYSEVYEKEDISKDGTEVPVNVRRWLITDEYGKPASMWAIVRDISERKRAEEEYRTIVRTAMDGFWLVDMEGRFLEVNDAYCRLIGYSREELLKMGIPDIEALETPEEVAAHVRKILERGWDRFETQQRCKDGEIIDVGVSVNYLDIDPGRMFVFLRDVTERKRAERELKRINLELEGFAHSVSHDLRGPLFASGLAVKILQELYKSPRTDENLEYIGEAIDTIDHNLGKSSALIEDLLSHAKAGMKPTEVADVDVGTVVQTVLEEEAGPIAEKGIEVVVAADLGHVVASDTQIYQIFANLIGNAVKYIDSASPAIEISYLGDDGKGGHRYLVRDNGSGIPPEHLDKVFIPFFTGETGETGIGLSTVEKIVRVYEGEIKAYNDNGACFEFSIRVRDFQEDQTS